MLKSLDVLIGLAVVMLALSMAVTVITQTITTVLNSRGRHLRRGLTDLLQQLDPALTETLSKQVATQILMHPLVSGASTPASQRDARSSVLGAAASRVRRLFGGPRLGNVVHREEFTKLLMAMALPGATRLPDDARLALQRALAGNGIASPDVTLKNVRAFALQLERSHPALSNAMRQNLAILHEAESDLVAKINSWFDQSMDRTSQRFTATTRVITFAGALLVAFGLQVDTVSLVNRLAVDDRLREALVQKAATVVEESRPVVTTDAAGAAAATAGRTQQDLAREYSQMLATVGIVRLPSSGAWLTSFYQANLLGLLVTALLLSLGAPFWYSALSRLLQLRSVLAAKDDAQRSERQSTQIDATAAAAGGALPAVGAGVTAAVVTGERGDLVAVG